MSSIFKYLDWRGDVPFDGVPFGEADNLLLSLLAYVDFGGIVPGPETGKRIGIEEVCSLFWDTHTEEQMAAENTFFWKAPFLLKNLMNCPRYSSMELEGYVNRVSVEDGEQFSAVTFYVGDGSVFVAFRGTDNTLVGWKEDFCFSFMKKTKGQQGAAEYLNRLADLDPQIPIRVGGHSKGGNLAVFAAAFCLPEVRDRIIEVYSNDGPGFLPQITETGEYQMILPKVRSFIPEESVFGLLLETGYHHEVIKSDEKSIYQHDGFSWQIMRDRLVRAEKLSDASLYMNKTLDQWIGGISMEERENFVNAIFDILFSGGAQTLGELADNAFKTPVDIFKAYLDMGPEDQKVINDNMAGLFKSGANVLGSGIYNKLMAKIEEMKGKKAEKEGTAETEEQGDAPKQ